METPASAGMERCRGALGLQSMPVGLNKGLRVLGFRDLGVLGFSFATVGLEGFRTLSGFRKGLQVKMIVLQSLECRIM